jgi:hypothetical protein
MARWVVALPVLMVGSLFYWSLALGLGGVSLMRLMALTSPTVTTEVEVLPDDADGSFANLPITVHLEESTDPADAPDLSGAAGPADTARGNTGAGGYVEMDVEPAPGVIRLGQ